MKFRSPKCVKFLYLLLSFLLFQAQVYSQEPIWTKVVSGTGYEYGVDSDIDSQGNVFVTGYSTNSTILFNGITYNCLGRGDAFIAKFSSFGKLIWFKTLGGDDNSYFDKSFDIHIDANDNVILLITSAGTNFTYNNSILNGINSRGQYSGEGVLLKVDNNGNYLWHDDGTVSSSFQSVTTDRLNNVYLTGWFSDSLRLGNSILLTNPSTGTTKDMFIAKYNSSGTIQWARNVGGAVHNTFAYGHNIEIDKNSGNLVVMGRFNKSVSFTSGNLTTTSSYATFLASYSSTGLELWKRRLFNNNLSYCLGLDISSNGMIGVAGYNSLSSNPDGLVGFYNTNGTTISESIYNSTSSCKLYNLEFNSLGESFISGSFSNSLSIGSFPNAMNLTTNYPSTGVVIKLGSNRQPLWSTMKRTSFENKVTCKDNRVLFSCRIDHSFNYNNNSSSISPVSGDALFTELRDSNSTCPAVLSNFSRVACNSYTWIDSITYLSNNNTAFYYIQNTNPNICDTVITLDLTINRVSNVTVSANNNIISSLNPFALYQWLDCNNGFSVINGETSQTFSPTVNGSYAVQLTQFGCVDTSTCINIFSVGLKDVHPKKASIYPNPTNGEINVESDIKGEASMELYDLRGKLLERKLVNLSSPIQFQSAQGIYLLRIISQNFDYTTKLIIDK